MIETQILMSLVASLFGLLAVILGWMGNKLYTKLDEMSQSLQRMAGELHTRINDLDHRLVKVETVCTVQHGQQK